jgi:hypothetical protein
MERRTFAKAFIELKKNSRQLSRELRYIPTIFLYGVMWLLLFLIFPKDIPGENKYENENQILRSQIDDLLLQEQKERICPPSELQKAWSSDRI